VPALHACGKVAIFLKDSKPSADTPHPTYRRTIDKKTPQQHSVIENPHDLRSQQAKSQNPRIGVSGILFSKFEQQCGFAPQ
jgi:hypothetical protein